MASQQRKSSKPFLVPALLLILLTGAVYSPVFNAGFIWDDDSMLNSFVRSTDGLRYIWFSTELPDYFPLTSTTLWLEHQLWGDRPLGYHIVNLLLHCVGSVVLWRVFVRLQIPGAWFAAALFSVHPVTVDSVAWIAERKNTLSFVFFVLSVLFYLKSEDRVRADTRSSERRAYVFSLFFFLLALLSKTAVVGLPFVLLLCSAWRNRGSVDPRSATFGVRQVVRLAPFFALALVLGVVTIWFQYNRAIGEDFIHDKPLLLRVATAGWAVWFYLLKAVWPLHLSFVYPDWNPSLSSVRAWLPTVALFGVFAFLVLRIRACFIARTAFYALTYFVLMLLPVLGLLKIYFHRYSPVADHWQYFALPAVTACVAAAIFYRWQTVLARFSVVRAVIAGGLLLACGVLSWQHARLYRDPETLWTATLAKNPGAWLAHNNLGLILEREGKRDEAIEHYSLSLKLQPHQVEAHNNLGAALLSDGKIDEALTQFETALKINPRSAITHYNIGNALDRQGNRDAAVASYREALRLNPNYVDAHNNLGCALALGGDIDAAVTHFHEALRVDPENVNVLNNLGSILVEKGKPLEAVPLLKRAVELSPEYSDAHYNLGNALLAVGDLASAMEHYSNAVNLNPAMPMAHYRLGNALLQVGRADEALSHYETALKLQPQMAEAHYQAGTILAAAGKTTKAVAHLKEAVRLKPDWVEALNNLAWLLATHANDEVRNGADALQYAKQAVELTGGNNPGVLGTLAAAYAETGDFKSATATLDKALALAGSMPPAVVGEMKQRLALYRSGRPFRQ